jgi:hypothetical protein
MEYTITRLDPKPDLHRLVWTDSIDAFNPDMPDKYDVYSIWRSETENGFAIVSPSDSTLHLICRSEKRARS